MQVARHMREQFFKIKEEATTQLKEAKLKHKTWQPECDVTVLYFNHQAQFALIMNAYCHIIKKEKKLAVIYISI